MITQPKTDCLWGCGIEASMCPMFRQPGPAGSMICSMLVSRPRWPIWLVKSNFVEYSDQFLIVNCKWFRLSKHPQQVDSNLLCHCKSEGEQAAWSFSRMGQAWRHCKCVWASTKIFSCWTLLNQWATRNTVSLVVRINFQLVPTPPW